jgi:hypothetical protein
MAAKPRKGNAVPVSDLTTAILDPVMRRRAGMSIALLQSWDEIVGEQLGRLSRPDKIAWPRRANEDDPFQPATLIVACEGAAAIRLQHMTSEIVQRVNAFLGFGAIAKVRLVQKQVAPAEKDRRPPLRPLKADEKTRVEGLVAGIDHDGLKAALERLGRNVLASRRP